MNIIKRTYDRLTGVLGYDYQGKPLRKGDLVEPAPHTFSSPAARCQMTIVGLPGRKQKMIDGRRPALVCVNPEGDLVGVSSWTAIRKITPPEQEARWENVERATGWKPQVREVEHG
ncbi:MAG: hypothetical protein CME80_08360 [Halomonas sp.]|nr:hypothetical protein [Halomonas sp.]MBF57716.1 hypothetical protein [Halomonas sp.]|tara:strand:+ start:18401 stop:18748 length:348 start_codon:yes stop_codon:yes gene_type:complete